MKLRILLFALLVSMTARAGIYYYHTDTVKPPHGSITAVEARAENSGGKWSLCWEDVTITVEPANAMFVDGIDEPLARITCGHQSVTSKAFDCYDGFNTVAAEWQIDGKVKILGGRDELQLVMTLDSLPKPQEAVRVVGAKKLSEIIIETNPNAFERLDTQYTDEEINVGTAWRYLDRETDPKIALLGGNYILAQVGDDLIYVSGAKTNAQHWHKGMLKGQLTPTGYVGYYRLQWYDATGRKLPDESYALFDDEAHTMKLVFPGLDASLRFTSLIQSGVAVSVK